jgi:hypothetical protein
MPVNSALPSRCLQSTVLSVSALATNPYHIVPFPFTAGGTWISWRFVSRAVRISPNSSLHSGCLAIRSSWLLLNDVRISPHRVSRTVGPAISPLGIASHGDQAAPQLLH